MFGKEGLHRVVVEGKTSDIERLRKSSEGVGGLVLVENVTYLEVLEHPQIIKLLYGTSENGFKSKITLADFKEVEVATLRDFEAFNETLETPFVWVSSHYEKLREGLRRYYSGGSRANELLGQEAAALSQTIVGNPMIPLRLLEEPAHKFKTKNYSSYGLGEKGLGLVNAYYENALNATDEGIVV
jgi:hypothetical protein